MNKILNFDSDIILGNLYNIYFKLQKGEEPKPIMGVKNIYFAGATLCMDYKGDVITLVHDEETYGFFSGGIRRLLSIEAMRLFEAIMCQCEIKHTQKWVTKKIIIS